MTSTIAPNHHSHYPGFTGPFGLIAALSMTVGRGSDAALASRLTGVTASDRVVDIGCGPGAAVRHAARLGATVTGVDPAAIMLRVARLTTGRGQGITYTNGTAESLPLPDASATIAWSIATVHHWQDVDGGIEQARRVLRPGGRFLAIERATRPGAHGHASHGWTEEQANAFAARCDALGFEGVTVDHHRTGKRHTLSVLAAVPQTATPTPSASTTRGG